VTPRQERAFRARGRVVWAAGVPAGLGCDNVCINAAHLQPAKKIGQLLYLRAATARWLHATHRPLGARLSPGRVHTSPKGRGCHADR
jgi:hypothetical protein